MSRDYDLVVIGGGAAGLTAARQARRRGARIALVSDGPVGGDCTFTGCVPSKTLLAAAARGDSFASAMAAVTTAVQHVAAEDDLAMQRLGVDVIDARATLLSAREVHAAGTRLRSRRIILATGSRPLVPRIPGLDDLDPLTSETLFDLESLPRRLVVLGGGAIGCEMAQAFARLGAEVTVVEAKSRVLPNEEPEASDVIAEALGADGVQVLAGERLM